MENTNFKAISTAKGFGRFVFDVSQKQPLAKLMLISGTTLEGKLFHYDHDNGVIVLIQFIDRFNHEYAYIPANQVVGLVLNHEENAKFTAG